MSKRHSVNQKKAKRLFSTTAKKVHPKNIPPTIMRGGYRM